MSKQLDLFGNETEIDWKEHWKEMPEYKNKDITEPAITVTFKFESETDFLAFKDICKHVFFNSKKPFDGMQKKDVKTAWWPPAQKANNFRYIDES